LICLRLDKASSPVHSDAFLALLHNYQSSLGAYDEHSSWCTVCQLL
jgi:hypothetical protein